ncbi:MAG: TonB-dependent receptor plug domain-containing protein [Flavobacteriaceae bacterium]|nr:TonB-dependent receptor plug domain-containing protein [Flavobacteriaceae bacterium]MBT6706010.1 TonB-dependent receptor plug domain-containing protein [Flavobacteriaceae bacterium]MBT7242702.1 TonB-dependent receptor plug domain-containing protein [Flavobacteriaceae bacterium]
MKNKYLIYLLLFLPLLTVFSQEDAVFSVEFNDVLVSKSLSSLEALYDVRFSYQDYVLKDKKLTLKKLDRTLNQVLDEISILTLLTFQKIDDRYIIVNDSKISKINIQLLDKVVITGYLTKGIQKNKDATFTINPEQLDILPGLIEADILESIQLLPGVISPNETATGFTVRGGAMDQNRVIWDGINIYHKGHLFGMLSAFNPNSTSKVIFHNQGTHSRFGERASSVIDISSINQVSNRFKAGVGVNGINTDVYIEAPIIKDKLSIQASLRRSYTELYQSITFNKIADKVFQDTKISNIKSTNNNFFFIDYNIKLNYQLNDANSFYASTIFIANDLNYLVEDMNLNKSYSDVLDIKNDGYSFGWNKKWSPSLSQNTQVFLSRYSLAYNYIASENESQISNFIKKNEIYDSGVSTEVVLNTKKDNNLTFGYQYVLKNASYLFKENAGPSIILDSDNTIVKSHALYVQYYYENPKLFDISTGIRVNYYQELDAVRLEPRILIYKDIFKNLKIQLSGEIKNQIISEIDETVLSDLSLENKLWRLADGETFPIINSKQLSAGFIYEAMGWSIDIAGYYKDITGKTALSLGFLNPDDSSFHIGEQHILGVNFYANKNFNFIKTWISYSFNNVISNFEGINNNQAFTASTNVRHSFTSSVAYKLKQFELALAWNWRAGKPYTQAYVGPEAQYYYIGINTGKLPNYHRLDFSSTYGFNFSKKSKLRGKVGFSIRNLYNKNNLLSRDYIGNNSINDPIVIVDKYSLGFTPNFLFRVFF